MSYLTERGREVFDQTPVEYPIKFERPTPLHLRIRSEILRTMDDMRHQNDFETPEEADDFDMPDDHDMWDSPYEGDFDHINDEKFSAASKEESADGGSSDGATQEKTESKPEA